MYWRGPELKVETSTHFYFYNKYLYTLLSNVDSYWYDLLHRKVLYINIIRNLLLFKILSSLHSFHMLKAWVPNEARVAFMLQYVPTDILSENFEELCSPYGISLRISTMNDVCRCDSGDRRKTRKIRSQLLPRCKEAAWAFLCRRFYYHNGRRLVLSTRSRFYKRDHSPLRPNFDPLHRREFWKCHRRQRHKRRSSEDRDFQANPGHLDISSRLSCWFQADVKEPYPQYVRLFSGTHNFLIFTRCQSEVYVYAG